jgi:hypothetical protein
LLLLLLLLLLFQGLNETRVVASTLCALVIEKVKGSMTLLFTVVAQDLADNVLVLFRHLVLGQGAVKHGKVVFHVAQGFPANGTLIRGHFEVFVAAVVDCMAARHEPNEGGGGEHVLSADGAVAVYRALDAAMIVLEADGHAAGTGGTVEKVLSQTLANATDSAVIAMVDLLGIVIVPEFALVAVIAGHAFLAEAAILTSRLNLFASHAKHQICGKPIKV